MDVKCSQCGEEYQLKPDENPSNFQCKCGGELIIKPDEATNIPKPSKHTPNNQETKTPEPSKSIFDDWKKQYMIVIAVVFLVFIIIAAM